MGREIVNVVIVIELLCTIKFKLLYSTTMTTTIFLFLSYEISIKTGKGNTNPTL